jgi:hypothetical protein
LKIISFLAVQMLQQISTTAAMKNCDCSLSLRYISRYQKGT